MFSQRYNTYALSGARGAGGPVPTPHPGGAVSPFKSPEDAWITDHMPPLPPEDWRDRMRAAERVQELTLHSTWARDIREADYVFSRLEGRTYGGPAAICVGSALALIAFVAVFAT